MPASTWTPIALASSARRWDRTGWRAVEAQHRVATMSLVHGSLADQALLEGILDAAKPVPPPETRGLHWLLATPFRYRSPPPAGSRFRARTDPGVFYGAEERQTACAECGYWRLRFWQDSTGLARRSASVAITLFEFHAATDRAIDLTLPPLDQDRERWLAPNDYIGTQALATAAREASLELIRYGSVRHPGGYCVALLTPQPFRNVASPYRETRQQSWNLQIEPPHLAVWQRSLDSESYSFSFPP